VYFLNTLIQFDLNIFKYLIPCGGPEMWLAHKPDQSKNLVKYSIIIMVSHVYPIRFQALIMLTRGQVFLLSVSLHQNSILTFHLSTTYASYSVVKAPTHLSSNSLTFSEKQKILTKLWFVKVEERGKFEELSLDYRKKIKNQFNFEAREWGLDWTTCELLWTW